MFKKRKMNRINRLIFFVTSRCNSKCSHCFYWKNLNAKDELSTKEVKKAIDNLGKLDWLYLSGGEPFLRQDLTDICKYFIDKCGVKKLIIPTNGTLEKQTIEFIKEISNKCKIKIHISLDGLKKTHDKIRGINCFNKAISLLKKLKELQKIYKFKFNVMITVSNKNISEIVSLGKYLDSLNLYFSITPIRGSPKDIKLNAPTSKQWIKLTDDLQKNTKGFAKGILSFLTTIPKKRMYTDALNGKRSSKGIFGSICGAGKYVGVLEYNGDVRVCELMNKIGNIRNYNYNFYDVWSNEKADKIRADKESVNICKFCTHTCFVEPKIVRFMRKIKG